MIVLGNVLYAIAAILNAVLQLVFWLIIIRAVLSWVNPDPYNPVRAMDIEGEESSYIRLEKNHLNLVPDDTTVWILSFISKAKPRYFFCLFDYDIFGAKMIEFSG